MRTLLYKDPQNELVDLVDPKIGYDIWKSSKQSVVKPTSSGVKIGKEEISEEKYYRSIMRMNMQYNNIPYYVDETSELLEDINQKLALKPELPL